MWAIWANKLLNKSLKSCPKSNKSPNLVSLLTTLENQVKAVLPRVNKYLILKVNFIAYLVHADADSGQGY